MVALAGVGETTKRRKSVSPLKWYGGKLSLLGHILPLIPAHKTYVEIFGGSGAVLLAKAPAPVEVYNDLDTRLVDFFQTVRTHPHELQTALEMTPYAREEHRRCKADYPAAEPIERARQFMVNVRQSFNAKFANSFSTGPRKNNAKPWANCVQLVQAAAERLKYVVIENLDCIELIKRYDTPESFFYLDPPYVPETRISKAVYKHEMTIEAHEAMLETIIGIQGKAMISGYASSLYGRYLASWNRVEIPVKAASGIMQAGGKRGDRVEVLWMNY